MSVVVIIIVIIILVVALVIAFTISPKPTACITDADCSTGKCLPWDVSKTQKTCCSDTFNTSSGTFCKGLVPNGGACNNDSLCSSSNCKNGVCIAPTPNAPCTSNEQCGAGVCASYYPPLSEVGFCTIPGTAWAPCDASPCSAGTRCLPPVSGERRKICCPEAYISGGVCVRLPNEASCVSPGQCASFNCISGKCGLLDQGMPCIIPAQCKTNKCIYEGVGAGRCS